MILHTTLTATTDSTDEPYNTEAVVIELGTPPAGTNKGSPAEVTVTLIDNNPTTVTLAATAGDITEGATKTFTVTSARALVAGEVLPVPLTFTGTATRNTDYTVACPDTLPTGVSCNNLNTAATPTVTFTGPAAMAVTVTLTSTTDNTTESGGETVDIGLGTLNASSGTNLGGGAAGTDNLDTFTINDPPAAGALPLTLAAIATDNTINLAERAAGFAISGTTGSEAGVAVTVTVTASKNGLTAAAVTRALTVDLSAPTAPTYTAPDTLTVEDAAGNPAETTIDFPAVDAEIIRVVGGGEDVAVTVVEMSTAVELEAMAPTSEAVRRQVSPSEDVVFAVSPVVIEQVGDRQLAEGEGRFTFCLPRGSVPAGYTAVIYLASGGDGSESSHWVALPNQQDEPLRQRVCATVSGFSMFRVGYDAQAAQDEVLGVLSISSASVREFVGALFFDVRLNKPAAQVVTVAYATQAGTATREVDYKHTSGTLRFEVGETHKQVKVNILDDDVVEGIEYFELVLSAPVNASLAQAVATGTIVDDDRVRLFLRHASAAEGAGEMIFRMELEPWSEEQVTVDYTTVDRAALAGVDYTAVAGTLTFAPGQRRKVLRVPLIDDAVHEDTESFTVQFSNLVNAEFERLKAVNGWVYDDDVRAIRVSPSMMQMSEGSTERCTIVLATQPTGEVTLELTTNNRAVQLSPARLTFDASNWSRPQQVTVTVPADTNMFDDEALLTYKARGADYEAMQGETILYIEDMNRPDNDGLRDTAPIIYPDSPFTPLGNF